MNPIACTQITLVISSKVRVEMTKQAYRDGKTYGKCSFDNKAADSVLSGEEAETLGKFLCLFFRPKGD